VERDTVGSHVEAFRQLMCDVDGLAHRIVVTPHHVSVKGIGPGFDSITVIVESGQVRPESLDEQQAMQSKVSGRRGQAGLLVRPTGKHEDSADSADGDIESRVRQLEVGQISPMNRNLFATRL